MTDGVAKTHADFLLPPSVVSRLDVSRLVREAERIDGIYTTATVQAKVGVAQHDEIAVSPQLAEFLQLNGLTLTANSNERAALIKELRLLKDAVPIIHMTFAVEADGESLAQLAQWVRSELHPQAVIVIGIQPALVAGVYMRTPNHVHDYSLRAKLQGSRDILRKELEVARG